jgi:hypothetical protein
MWKLIGAAMAAVVGVCVMAGYAAAQDRGAWFKSLRQPGTNISCCDVSDCKRTEAEYEGGGWVADSVNPTQLGQRVVIPDASIVRNIPSIDGEAYLCQSPTGRVYCFIPPSPGS